MRACPLLVALTFGGLALAAACSDFSNADAPSSPDAAGVEADAPADATASSSDSGADVDAQPVRGCARYAMPRFCDDFDSNTEPAAAWIGEGDAGTGLVIGPPAFSAPASLEAKTVGDTPAVGPHYRASHDATGTTHLRLELELMTEMIGDTSTARIGLAVLGPAGIEGFTHLRLEIQSNRLALSAVATGATSTMTLTSVGLPPVGKWHHVVISADYASTESSVELTIDGMSEGPQKVALPAPTTASFGVGILYGQPASGAWALRFDDVAFFAE